MLITSEEIFEKFEGILEYFEKPRRIYNLQSEYDLSRGEAQLILDTLVRENYLEVTSVGWKAVK